MSNTFLKAGTEFLISDMFPKREWYNYLWNEKFIAKINQFGGGPSWNCSGDSRFEASTYGDSRLFFIRNKENGKYWSPNRNFERKQFEEFSAKVGQGYHNVTSVNQGIRFSWTMFIPQKGDHECWIVNLKNETNKVSNFSFFSYVTSGLNSLPQTPYNCGKFNKELDGVVLNHHAWNVINGTYFQYLVSDIKPDAYETSDRRFKGVYGSINNPDAVKIGNLASEDTTFDGEMIAALQLDISLQPGEEKRINFISGLACSLEEAVNVRRERLSTKFFDNELEKINNNALSFAHTLSIDTPDEDINLMTNVWLKRQIDLGKTWARAYARGFRDIMQDITAFLPLQPAIAAEKIIYCLRYQFYNGNTVRHWEPLEPHPYVDGPVWLIYTVTQYLKETGNFAFLETFVPYYDSQKNEAIIDHCRKGMDFLLFNLGKHGLCLWGGGDWNDSINGAGLKGVGESVWLTEATILATKNFEEMLRKIGENIEADQIKAAGDNLIKAMRKHAWEKDHFLCGFTDWDEKVGSYENDEGKFFLNMQTWAVLSDVADEPEKLMNLVEQNLKCPWGYVLSKPSYTKGDDHIGRASFFEPGCYENGSVYNHGGTFKIAADCKLGRGQLAYKTVKMMLPTNPENPAEKSGSEPYAITNMYLGPESVLRAGESLMGWITGTAGWLFRCITENMLGVQAHYDGLVIQPCLPEHWKDVNITRNFRGSSYKINILNPLGLQTGKISVTLDDVLLEGNIIPPISDGKTHKVIVKLK